MKSFYSPDGQVKFELKNGLVEIHYKEKVYVLHSGECDLMLHKKEGSFGERTVKSVPTAKTSKSTSPPYANSWDYHTYVKSEDCDG
mgnify:CR=1 FL=1